MKDLFSAVTESIIPKDPLYNTPGYTLNEKIAVALALVSPKGNLFYEDRFDNLYGPGRSEEIKTLLKEKNSDWDQEHDKRAGLCNGKKKSIKFLDTWSLKPEVIKIKIRE